MNRARCILGLAAVVVLLAGCGASTTVKTMWKDPEFNPEQERFKKVFIAGIYQTQGNGLAFESEMKKQFAHLENL